MALSYYCLRFEVTYERIGLAMLQACTGGTVGPIAISTTAGVSQVTSHHLAMDGWVSVNGWMDVSTYDG